jgi:D-lactate dehydrogenase
MKIAVYSSHSYEGPFLTEANNNQFELIFLNEPLSRSTTQLSSNCKKLALFTSDDASEDVLKLLHKNALNLLLHALQDLITLI